MNPHRLLLFLVLASGLGLGQTYLAIPVDARPPVNSDNHRELIVVQPSRHGGVIVQPHQTGPTGWLALSVLSLDADYAKDNQSLLTSFVSLDVQNHLLLPLPDLNHILNTLALSGPFLAGSFVPLELPVQASTPTIAETALYYQCAAIDPLGVLPTGLSMQWSNGVTLVQTEAPGTLLAGPAPALSAKLGAALAVGDFNGDGVDDLAVAAPGETVATRAQAGQVRIHLGVARTATLAGGLHPVPFLLNEPAIPGNPGPEIGARFGSTLVAADFDGDGVTDLAIAAADAGSDQGQPARGEVYIVQGLSALLASLPAAPVAVKVPPASIRVLQSQAPEAGARFGFRMAAADIDGDGRADLAVASPFHDAGVLADTGRVEIYRPGVAPAGAPVLPDAVLTDDVVEANDRFGGALHFARIDAVGAPELIVGVPGQAKLGIAGSGKIDVITWIGSTPLISAVLDHPVPAFSAGFGCSLASADLDGDGTDEVFVASEDAAMGLALAGMVRIFAGLGTVSPALVDTIISPAPQMHERFGTTLLARDLNADGVVDVAIGAPGCAVGPNAFAGQVFVAFRAKNLAPTHPGFRSLHVGSAGATPYRFFGAALAAGDFAGVGVQDLVAGAPGLATGGFPGAGAVSVHPDLLHRRNNRHRSHFLPPATP